MKRHRAHPARRYDYRLGDTVNIEADRRFLRRVVKLDPKNPGAHYSRGQILEEMGRYGKAHKEFRQAAKLSSIYHDFGDKWRRVRLWAKS